MGKTKAEAVLVTGGAGYIGSHAVRELVKAGRRVLVLDNLVYGHRAAVDRAAELIVGEVGDAVLVADLFARQRITAVVHFAAYAYVGESVQEPAKYYRNNMAAPLALFDAMRAHGCSRFIFSSTCATYGNPVKIPMDEQHPQQPINPYGRSKRMLEQVLEDYDHAYGLKSVRLRYFNACGAAEDGALGEDHHPETHVVPRVLMAARGELDKVQVFGTDYATPDGTCIRDYIHVEDLADAHVKALQHLEAGKDSLSCNLGTGRGVSVKELIEFAAAVTGQRIPVEFCARRAGDPPELVADPRLAAKVLGWKARRPEVRHALETAWRWMNGPGGGRYPK